eukprot:4441761-Pyramimonas_sp.AAC.1
MHTHCNDVPWKHVILSAVALPRISSGGDQVRTVSRALMVDLLADKDIPHAQLACAPRGDHPQWMALKSG